MWPAHMRLRSTIIALVAPVAMAAPAAAQPSFDVVHAFGRGPTAPDGRLIETADGRFFGTSQLGGTFDQGTVFVIERGTNGWLPITPVHSFGGPGGGSSPRTGLMAASDGALYGTTYFGGTHGYGTAFRLTLDGTVTTIHSFDGVAGAHPGALMQARDGFLYGVTEARLLPNGALPFTGTIFRISTGGTFNELHQLDSHEDGARPVGPLVQAPDGTFYGMTESGGGLGGGGTIFQLTEGGIFTRLHSFGASLDGGLGPLIFAADGSLYGIAGWMSNGPGAVFRRTPDGTVTFIHLFTAGDHFPRLHFQHADGTLIGTTQTSAFRVTTSGTLTTLRAFSDAEGRLIRSVMQAADGRLYGLAVAGGITDRGTAFGMTYAGVLTGLNPFIVDDQPMQPVGSLVVGTDGSVFGVTCRGGWLNAGTVYKRSPAGVITTLKSFFGPDGRCPISLIRGSDGFLYGTTLFGGVYMRGTVFRVSEAGAFRLLHTFSGLEGSYPDGLMQARSGQLWGTTYHAGGSTDTGAIFRLSTTGALGAAFALESRCHAQLGPQAPSGAIYGTTRHCANTLGTLFKISEAGAITTLNDVGHRPSPLMFGSDGNLYGTVEAALEGPGAIFVSTLAGQFTQIHTFAGAEGEVPKWGLIEGQDGLLYGTTLGPDSIYDPLAPNVGTVFSATKSGTLTVLHTFSFALTGGRPFGPLMQTPNGAIFGTTLAGGPAGQGVLFRILPGGGSQ